MGSIGGRWHGISAAPTARGFSTALRARGMPLTAFYDDRGELLHVPLGGITEPQLRSFIIQLYEIGT
jgi:hypothetical protein